MLRDEAHLSGFSTLLDLLAYLFTSRATRSSKKSKRELLFCSKSQCHHSTALESDSSRTFEGSVSDYREPDGTGFHFKLRIFWSFGASCSEFYHPDDLLIFHSDKWRCKLDEVAVLETIL